LRRLELTGPSRRGQEPGRVRTARDVRSGGWDLVVGDTGVVVMYEQVGVMEIKEKIHVKREFTNEKSG